MLKLWRLKRRLKALEHACLWLSGGARSRLLLEVMVESGIQFSVLRFDDTWDRRQREAVDAVIAKHGLRVYSYRPLNALMTADESGTLSIMTDYSVDVHGNTVPIKRDLAPGTRCSFEIPMVVADFTNPPIVFERHITGARDERRRRMVGDAEFTAPLYDWSDDQVSRALWTSFGIAGLPDTGRVRCCSKCLEGEGPVFCPKDQKDIDSVVWDPTANRRQWQAAHGV